MLMCDIEERIKEVVEAIKADMTPSDRSSRSVWPLDQRACPSSFWFDENSIMVHNNESRMLDYYGGFEYVDSDHRKVIGDYTIYVCEDDYDDEGHSGRVDGVVNALRPFLKE